MLISLSGRMNSGKDLVGQIIQYLTSESYKKGRDYETFIRKQTSNLDFEPHYISKWQIKKFADKLKDIICLLINCTRDQLEDESFKSKELGEEWWKVKSTMIHNDKFKTKDVIYYDYKHLSFLNDTITNLDKTQFISMNIEVIKTTPRLLLQLLGTEAGRQIIHPQIWVNSLMSEYKLIKDTKVSEFLKAEGLPETMNGGKEYYPNWIITDMRFLNEMEAVKKKGGITIRVNRPCSICGGSGCHKMSWPVSKSGEHYSEIALDKSEFDYVIDNNSDVELLIKKVKEILIKEKLL